MAVGSIQIAGIAGVRGIAPMAYANPFNGGLMSWIADPSHNWDIISYVVAALVLGSAVCLINGAVTFFEMKTKTAAVTAALFVGVMIALAEGGRMDPTNYKHLITMVMFGLAFFSTCGAVFARAEEKPKGN